MDFPLAIQWHYSHSNNSFGPVAEPELKRMLISGSLPANTQIWHRGLSDWMPAKNIFLPQESSRPICSVCGEVLPQSVARDLENPNVCDQCEPLSLHGVGASSCYRAA